MSQALFDKIESEQFRKNELKFNVGDTVTEGQTLMIVEAMKTMNQIPAPRAGKVTRILVGDGDTVEVTDLSPAARPGLGDPLIAALVERNGLEVRAKLGWTDVAFFAERGVPASNFGPGDATIAHTQGEYLERQWLVDTHTALRDLVINGV